MPGSWVPGSSQKNDTGPGALSQSPGDCQELVMVGRPTVGRPQPRREGKTPGKWPSLEKLHKTQHVLEMTIFNPIIPTQASSLLSTVLAHGHVSARGPQRRHVWGLFGKRHASAGRAAFGSDEEPPRTDWGARPACPVAGAAAAPECLWLGFPEGPSSSSFPARTVSGANGASVTS